MKLIELLFYLTALIVVTCTAVNSTSVSTRITGGYPATAKQFPYYVYLQVKTKSLNSFICGGSLISRYFVLTAHHCVCIPKVKLENGKIVNDVANCEKIKEVNAIFGAYDLQFKYRLPQIRVTSENSFIVHPDFLSDRITDIALIHLPWPVQINEFVRPVKLPSDDSGNYVGQSATIIGHGRMFSSKSANPRRLQYVKVDIINNRGYDGRQLLIKGRNGKGPCEGDSGGPLVVKSNGTDILVGLESYYLGNHCDDDVPHYTVRVSRFLDFIKQHVRDLN